MGSGGRELPDLALRSFGGSVVYANDEFFAERHALIRPDPPSFQPRTFGAKGQVYDGWETRRRRDVSAGSHDVAMIRLGATGVIRVVVVDTAHFTGNFPPEVSVEGAWLGGNPSVKELDRADWQPLVERTSVKGDSENAFPVTSVHRYSHVRLRIYPDGGVARLRVHGEVVAEPALLQALDTIDLLGAEHGGRVLDCSDRFYGSPDRLIAPGLARSMGEGWETARRRGAGNDWVLLRLAVPGNVRVAELDTSWFLGNAPAEAALTAYPDVGGETTGRPLLQRVALQPDTRHRFVLPEPAAAKAVRLDVFPDGGMARLRLWGRPTPQGLADLQRRWDETAPSS